MTRKELKRQRNTDLQKISFGDLGVTLGYGCNFRCAHCVVSDKDAPAVSDKEIALIIKTINRYKVGSLLLVGGEPTLYINAANKILSGLNNLRDISVRLTTNGGFADSKERALEVLRAHLKLDRVQLSYDRYHSGFLPINKINNLYLACRTLGLGFHVVVTIGGPLDLLMLGEIKKQGNFRIVVQKVLPVGEALKNSIDYAYPSFDPTVLKKKCPNLGSLMYMPGKGFTVCCSSLVFNGETTGFVHKTAAAHLRSRFHKELSAYTFSELLEKKNISAKELNPKHSSMCNLCELVFKPNINKAVR